MAELTNQEIAEKILTLVQPLMTRAGIDMVDLKIGRHKNEVMIQILTDKPTGGISIEECSQLNRSLGEAIDQDGFLPLDCYALEVSSPGLDRPLKTYKDFLRNVNYEIRLMLNERLDGKKEITGVLMGATEVAVTLYTSKKVELVIPLANIEQGLLVI